MSYLDDPVFRSVEGILAPGAVAHHLSEAWTDWMGEVPDAVAVATDETTYEPFEGAALTAEASVVPKFGSGETVSLGLVLRVFPNANALGRAAERELSRGFVPSAGPPFFTIPSCHTAAWTSPNGPGLPWTMETETFSLLAGATGQPYTGGCEGLPSRLVRYSPPEMPGGEYRASRDARLVVKLLDPGAASRTWANYAAISAAREGSALGFEVPRVVASDLERNAIVLNEPAGHSFVEFLREPFREPFEKVGRALASLHSASMIPTDMRSPESLMDDALRAAKRIARALPEMDELLSRVVATLLAGAVRGAGTLRVPIHGRLAADCIVIDGPTVGIRRWDWLTTGHPYRDVAAVIAQTVEESVACGTPSSVTRACVRALMQSYDAARDRGGSRRELHWHLAHAMLVRAGEISLRRLRDGWHERLIALVAEADALQTGRSRCLRGC